jgi:hypothetical protein
MSPVTLVCFNYHQNKVKMIWSSRFDIDTRCEIRFSLRKLREIRDFGNTIQAF